MLPAPISRRAFVAQSAAAGLFAMLPRTALANADVRVHRHEQTAPYPVNAFLIEGPEGVVTVDATLTAPDAAALSAAIDATGKPLRAMLLTHAHPDHFGGLAVLKAGRDVPVIALDAVRKLVPTVDEMRTPVLRQMFGELWPDERIGPDTTVSEGELMDFGPGLRFRALDIGPAESVHDSVFVLEDSPHVFAGDLAYSGMHAYMGDLSNPHWLRALDRLAGDLPASAVLHVGHGPEGSLELFERQKTYLQAFEAALRNADWRDPEAATEHVIERMQQVMRTEALLFLLQLSIEPNARALGLL